MADRVHAPFGFVPLQEQVYLPEAAARASHDWPLRDGICGTLTVEVTSHTPIFVRGEGERFFRDGSGLPALPGSTLRGALRTVVEIATFGWMRRFNDHRYGVRDLTNRTLYADHLAQIRPTVDGADKPVPLVMAGWLEKTDRDDVVATITPCDFAKVHYRHLAELAGVRADELGRSRLRHEKASAPTRYRRLWRVRGGDREPVDVTPLQRTLRVSRFRKPHDVPLDVGFYVGSPTSGTREVHGQIVVTGQPADWRPPVDDGRDQRKGGHPKQHDFFFFGDRPDLRVDVNARAFQDFEFVHAEGHEQHSLNKRRRPNAEWKFWEGTYHAGGRVPVFFLLQEGARASDRRLRAFGLAMMFRLAYDHTVGDAVRNAQPRLGVDPRPDFAEALFGHVPLAAKGRGGEREPLQKGRVSVGMGKVTDGGAELDRQQGVLGSPKASYYPIYVEQVPGRPGSRPDGRDYVTYMDGGARIRGHKRYRPQSSVMPLPPPPQQRGGTVNTRVVTRFYPLAAGTTFSAPLRVHNVRPAELGALLWALDFGGEDGAFHLIGLAKAFGYGRCTVRVVKDALRRNEDLAPVDLDAARQAFVDEMEAFCAGAGVPGGWAGSQRMRELLALTKVLPDASEHRKHMPLKEFSNAKLDRDRPVLPMASGPGDTHRVTPASPSPRRPDRAPPAPTPATLSGGDPVEVRLTTLNKKGKWKCCLAGPQFAAVTTRGTLEGTAPSSAAEGGVYTVVVLRGGDLKNLGLKWPEDG